jgi:multiple sugar transport system ATP-binding protein
MARIRFNNLGKRFGQTVVADGLDLDIEDGEFFTFLGPSGCGKSSLLHLVAGIESPSTGSIEFDGRAVDHLAPQDRDVAMVFQSYALYPHLSVRGNLAFPLQRRGLRRQEIDARVEHVAGSLGLQALLERKPGQLSGGQRQRVALGRALVRRPAAFLMDEPLSNLDARLRLEMREELKRLHAVHKVTTLFVTHDQEEAMVLSDRIAVLCDGRVQQCDTPAAIYHEPANLFVATFVGSPGMNILPGELVASEPALASHLNCAADTVVGVRPADVTVGNARCVGAVPAEVVVVEPTGPDTWVVGEWHGTRIKGRAAPAVDTAPGDTAWFRIPAERAYLFDAASGVRRLNVLLQAS